MRASDKPDYFERMRVLICTRTGAFAQLSSIRQHTPAYVSIRQHTPAYVEYKRLAVAQLSASRSSGRELKPAIALTKPAAQREPLFWM